MEPERTVMQCTHTIFFLPKMTPKKSVFLTPCDHERYGAGLVCSIWRVKVAPHSAPSTTSCQPCFHNNRPLMSAYLLQCFLPDPVSAHNRYQTIFSYYNKILSVLAPWQEHSHPEHLVAASCAFRLKTTAAVFCDCLAECNNFRRSLWCGCMLQDLINFSGTGR